MPNAKPFTRRTHRKPYKKPASRKTSKALIRNNRITGAFRTNNNDPFTQKKFCKLVYTEEQLLASGVGNLFGTELIYSLNSVHDPRFSTGGTQPYGHDTLATMYRKYKVSGCLIELTWTDPSSDGMVVGAAVQPPGAITTVGGQTISRVKQFPNAVTRPVNDSGSQTTIMKSYIPIASISGLTELQFKSDTDIFAADVGASPAAIPKLRIAAATSRSVGADIAVRIKLTYFCQFYDRITLPAS